MDISVDKVEEVTVVRIVGDINGSTAPEAQSQILPLVYPGASILLDMTGVAFMASSGLRMLLSTYRQVVNQNGRIALVGLAEELKDTMEITGFLRFFTNYATVDEGLKALK